MMKKKKIIIVIIIAILVIIPVGIIGIRRLDKLTVPPTAEKETKYIPDTEYIHTSEEEGQIEDWIEETRKSSEEQVKKVNQANEILKKYNPERFDYVYNEIMRINSQGKKDELESIQEEALTIMLDTYEKPELKIEEREILKYFIIEMEEYFESIPSLVTRFEKIINE